MILELAMFLLTLPPRIDHPASLWDRLSPGVQVAITRKIYEKHGAETVHRVIQLLKRVR